MSGAGDIPDPGAGAPVDEEEFRARLEEELKRITVRDVLLQTIVTLVNVGGQRLGLVEGTQDARDPEQTRVAIEAVRSLLPLLETDPRSAEQVRPIRDALAQLQMAYAREAEAGTGAPAAEGEEPPPGGAPPPKPRKDPPPPRRPGGSGGLWVPPGSKT
jgi:hypothetical protein